MRQLGTIAIVTVVSGCCLEEESACAATEQRARPTTIDQGIAGVVAYQTDAGERNGCFPCNFTSTTLELVATDALITSSTEASDALASAVVEQLGVNARYERFLEPGFYLLCDRSDCAGLEVESNRVTTANVQETFGPQIIKIFRPNGERGAESFPIDR